MDSKRSKWPLREQPALRSWRPVWKMGNTGILGNTAMELVWKAKLWAALPESHAETANFLQDGCITAKRQTSWKSVQERVCKAWTPTIPKSDSRFRPFHLPESKTSAMGRHEGSFRISFYTQFLFLSVLPCQLTEIREWSKGFSKSKPRKHLVCH